VPFYEFSMKETGQGRTKGARKYRTDSAVDVETVGGVAGERKCVRNIALSSFWIKQNSEVGLAPMRPHRHY
jgi:hypothetical protein